MARYSYAIMSLTPDQRRGERVNIGLVVYLGDSLDVRVLSSYNKVRALGGKVDPSSIKDLPALYNKLIQAESRPEHQHALLCSLNSDVILSDKLGWFEIHKNDEYELAVSKLMKQFVIPAARMKQANLTTRIQTEVKAMFKQQGILGGVHNDITKHLVVPHYPIAEEENLYADFALKNGVYHITETIDYRVKNPAEKFSTAAVKAITLDKALKTLGKETKRFVVYSASSDIEAGIQTHLNLVSDYADHVLNMQSRDEMAFYIDIMMQAASSNNLLN